VCVCEGGGGEDMRTIALQYIGRWQNDMTWHDMGQHDMTSYYIILEDMIIHDII
jgi:hypothetical protein